MSASAVVNATTRRLLSHTNTLLRPLPKRKSIIQSRPSSLLDPRFSSRQNGDSTDRTEEEEQRHKQQQSSQKKSDLIVLLDMDECLIHSQFLSQSETTKSSTQYRQFEENRPMGLQSKPEACESFRVSLPDGDIVHVNKRPNLDTFLEQITSRFETHIFTAAMEIYANPVLNTIDPRSKLSGRFYRESCLLDRELNVYVKDFSRVLPLYNERRVVLVDNNPLSFLAQPRNGILVSDFYDDPSDDTLPAVMDLLDELVDEGTDVREVLDGIFGMKTVLEEALDKSIMG